jgi:hypothetical protein
VGPPFFWLAVVLSELAHEESQLAGFMLSAVSSARRSARCEKRQQLRLTNT